MERRPPDPARRDSERRRRADDAGQDLRDRARERNRDRSIRRRRLRLQGLGLVARRPRRPRCQGGWPAGQARARAATDVRLGRQPPAYRADARARLRSRRPAHRGRAPDDFRDVDARGLVRELVAAGTPSLCLRQQPLDPPHRQAQHRDADLHARAGRGERQFRARVRDGRARLRPEDRSARTAPAQLRRAGSEQEPAVLEQVAARVLSPRRRALRLAAARGAAGDDARRSLARRPWHGDRHLPGQPQRRRGAGAAATRRQRRRPLGDARPRHRHLHRDVAGRRRRDRRAGREGPLRARRLAFAEGAGRGRIAVGGERRAGGPRRRAGDARQADRAGDRRSALVRVPRRRGRRSR